MIFKEYNMNLKLINQMMWKAGHFYFYRWYINERSENLSEVLPEWTYEKDHWYLISISNYLIWQIARIVLKNCAESRVEDWSLFA